MMAQSYSIRARRDLTVGDGGYRGLDLLSSPLDADMRHACEAVNLTIEDGMVRKRPGWAQTANFSGRINGVWTYNTPDTEQVIAHVGTRFYRLDTSVIPYAKVDITQSSTVSKLLPRALSDTRSQAFLSKERLYIIGCGDYLVYGTWDGGETYELRSVYDGVDTYIPITTQGLTPIRESDAGEYASSGGEVLDDVNLLTPWRKNLLTAVPGNLSWREDEELWRQSESFVYILDAIPDADTDAYLILYQKDGSKVRLNFRDGSFGSYYDGDVYTFGGFNSLSIGLNYGKGRVTVTIPGDYDNETIRVKNPDGSYTVYDFLRGEGVDFAEIEFCHVPTAEDAQSEEFVPYDERIAGCSFGTLYGVSGNLDRLFLAGNPKTPNIEYYSYAGATEDFTYFPDIYYVIMGTGTTAISGFARLSDNTLAVFKDKTNMGDSTVFYQTGYYEEYTDSSGMLSRVEGIFKTRAGNIGEELISRYAVADMGGDPLFLSPGGVYGIVLTDNVSTDDRYARERSASVRSLITSENMSDLRDAVACVFRNKYYLSVGDRCYVADAKYRLANEKLSNSYGYEWHVWDNVPARVFFVLDDRLCFGTSDGRICVFGNEFTDEKRKFLTPGELALDVDAGTLTYRGEYHFSEGDRLHISTPGVFAVAVARAMATSSGPSRRFTASEGEEESLIDGLHVFADRVGESGLTAGGEYVIDDVDLSDRSFALMTASGDAVTARGGFSLNLPVSGRTLWVARESGGSLSLKQYADGFALSLTSIGTPPISLTGWIAGQTPVRAQWISPFLCPDGADTVKSLSSLTVTPEPGVRGTVGFGYLCLRGAATGESHMQGLAFDDLDFRNFDFIHFAASKTVRAQDRCNFIRFRFYSDTAEDFAVPRLTITYKSGARRTGVH